MTKMENSNLVLKSKHFKTNSTKSEFDKILADTVKSVPWRKPAIVSGAASWLLENGIISDFHKNTLVLGVFAEDKRIKDVEFYMIEDDGKGHGKMICYIYLTRFNLLFSVKRRLAKRIENHLESFLKGFAIAVRFRLFGKREKTKPFLEAK